MQPRLAGIRLHPIKALDPISVTEARIGPAGGLELDRAWALYTVDNRWVNGKRTPAIFLIRAEFAPDLSRVKLSVPGDRRSIPAREFAFPQDHESAAEWFSVYFDQQIIVRHSRNGFPDDTIAHGPTIVSTASLQAVCDWFPEITLDEARRRFRATLEIDDAPAFWEDRLFGPKNTYAVRFRVGEVDFEGSNPCARCSVPPRDSYTGADGIGFQKRFSELRQKHLPTWATTEHFDHHYRLSTNTNVPPSECGKTLRVGDPLILQQSAVSWPQATPSTTLP
jgi:MOSC domain-containing protein